SAAQRECAARQVVNGSADDVGRHQVGRELDAAVLKGKGSCDRLRKQGLAGAGHTFEQDVALRHERDRTQANGVLLPHHRFDELIAEATVEIGWFDGAAVGHLASLGALGRSGRRSGETGYATWCRRWAAFNSSASPPAEPYRACSASASSPASSGARIQRAFQKRSRGWSGRPVRAATARSLAVASSPSVTARAPDRRSSSPSATAHSTSARAASAGRGMRGPKPRPRSSSPANTATRSHNNAAPQGVSTQACGEKSLRVSPWWYSSNATGAAGPAVPSRSASKRPLSSFSR